MWACAGSDYTVDPLCTYKAHDIYHDRFLDLLYNNGDNPVYLLVGMDTENNWNTHNNMMPVSGSAIAGDEMA